MEDVDLVSRELEGRDHSYESVFLQDADPMGLPTPDLVSVLGRIREKLPTVTRVTTYGRASSVYLKSLDELRALREAGLTRIHRGLETGYGALLKYMKKGASARLEIDGGRRVKESGIELCDYVMPGLGGNLHLEGQPTWRRHAEETARVINLINPDFIRLRTLRVFPGTELSRKVKKGEFERLSDREIVEETGYFIEGLGGITSRVESDHLFNPLMELRGTLPGEKEGMLRTIDRYLGMSNLDQVAFRALGYMGIVDLTLENFEMMGGSGIAVEAFRMGDMREDVERHEGDGTLESFFTEFIQKLGGIW